jgi:hypothetical protein
LPGIFNGEHYFKIVSLPPSRVKFIHGETLSGVLVPFAKSVLNGGIKAGFIAMDEALRSLAERNTNARFDDGGITPGGLQFQNLEKLG